METRAPRQRVGRAERERQILDAAVAVFSERGYQNASMDAVAKQVGVTKPVLYSHFGSKEGLLLACITQTRTQLLEVTSVAAAAADGPEDMLRRGTKAFFDFLDVQRPAWALLCSESAISAATCSALEEIRRQQTDFIAGMLAVQVPDADPHRLIGWANVIVGACERLAVWRGRDPRLTGEQATEYLMDLVWTGLAPRRP
ncbi:TetR/AcrR family transcriptional regulator [Pseudonocardia asaccharolytica]|uniref:TetR family transcriptional regulator n=1 Tax=Pseudonocardia asaccharolytica DSM 44247 = NBRC 16224 TaxID=1123024 RepID=A0A511CZ99_9PSEU|nr:TetR/AcrR family transcriptional regulator [Pseudonocardia asaccharolytica]GEL17871.1 TetR family transcriptional regulator [Pseudonocardia asaccharolytica DSM 44247 = NBRC 16224]